VGVDERLLARRALARDQNRYPLLETDIHFCKIATLWRQEANLWREIASNNLQSSLKWEDGQFSFHLSLDKLKRPALAGRGRRGRARQRVRSRHVQGLRAVAFDQPKDRKSSRTRGRGRAKHWIKLKNRQHPAMEVLLR
jgi:hypothetical protein